MNPDLWFRVHPGILREGMGDDRDEELGVRDKGIFYPGSLVPGIYWGGYLPA